MKTGKKGRKSTDAPVTPVGDSTDGGGEVVVRGLGRYMELKQMARAQADAQRQREQRAFIIEPSARSQPYTVPTPFKTHAASEAAAERTQRMLKQVEEERLSECTFHPKTNELSVKQLLKQAEALKHAEVKELLKSRAPDRQYARA